MPRSKPGVRVVGQKELTRILKALGPDAVDEIKRAHLEAAKIVERAAKPKAPAHGPGRSVISGAPYWYGGPRHRSGQMRGTIRSAGTQRGGFVRAGRKAVPYAGPVHFGWPSRPNPDRRWFGGPIAPNPFLYDALDERREEVADAFARYIDDIRRKNGI